MSEGLEAVGQLDPASLTPAAFRGKEVTMGGDEFSGVRRGTPREFQASPSLRGGSFSMKQGDPGIRKERAVR